MMDDKAHLDTPRIRLRPICPDDAEELHVVFRDPAVRRYLLDDEEVPLEWVVAEIESSERSFAEHGWGIWAIRRSDDRAIAGFVGFRHFFDPPELQLLYGLLPRYWGGGLATEAARAVVAYAFDELGFAEVIAATDSPNRASVRVMERLGMRFLRRTGDEPNETLYYSLARRRDPHTGTDTP